MVKTREANAEKANLNQIEKLKEFQEKAPLIDLATDFYEGADVVEIDMGISYNSSINNNSLLNSKNYNEKTFKKSKLDSINKRNIVNNNLEIFEGSLENIKDEGNDSDDSNENENSINEFKLNNNTFDDIKEKKILIENLDEINIEMDLAKNSPEKKRSENKPFKASGMHSSPSTKNFLLNNLNKNNNTFKYLKTNFESTRNMNTNFNLNSNKNLFSKKSTAKNSFVNNHTNNTLKSEDAFNNNNNTVKEKTTEKFPHSKTLKILKNNHLNFMNNAFKILSEPQSNLNFNNHKFEKAKTLLTFSKEKDNQALSFRVKSKKTNNTPLKNLTILKKETLKNSHSTKPIQEILSKRKIRASDNLNNLETKRTTSNNRSLLSNKLIFNTTTDLKDEMKKPYSQDKDLSKRNFITDKSLNKMDLKDSVAKNNLNFTINNQQQQNKNKKMIFSNVNKKNNLIISKKKFEKGKNDNFISNKDKKISENRISSDITFISNKNAKGSNLKNYEKKIINRKSVSNNPLSYKNDVGSNKTTNLNINCTINNTNPNNNSSNNNYVFTVNQTIENTNSEKNFNTVKCNNTNNNYKQSLNKSNNNLNNDKKAEVNNYLISNNNNNQNENTKNQKLNHNISQKYLKQFFSSLSKNTIIGNVNVNISNSNLKITQNMAEPQNTNLNASFKSNYRNSEIPVKNNIEISFESADEANLNENVFIEDLKLAKNFKAEKDSKRKSLNSPPLIVAKKAINKMLNRPVSEYKIINLKDYNIIEDNNQILVKSSENLCDINAPSKNQILTEQAENSSNSKINFGSLKNNLSEKHFEIVNVNLNDRNNNSNQNKGRVNNTYRNTLNINMNGKKNFFSNNINNNMNNGNNVNNNNYERANTYSNQKVYLIINLLINFFLILENIFKFKTSNFRF